MHFENKIFLSNHPETFAMVLPVAMLLLQYNNVTIIGADFFSMVPGLDLISIPTKPYKGMPMQKYTRQRLLTGTAKLFRPDGNPQIETKEQLAQVAVEQFVNGHSLFMAPAGVADKEGVEREWKCGIGHILLTLTEQCPSVPISFMKIHSALGFTVHDPISLSRDSIENNSPKDITVRLQEMYNQTT